MQGKLGKLLYFKWSWGKRKFIENEYADMDGLQEISFYNTYTNCEAAMGHVIVMTISSERRCASSRL